MTMILGASTYWYALMVSDRLVTLQRPGGGFAGRHDPAVNKTVVFLTEDAVVALGYTGSAYLEGIPTDQWIAQTLWGAPIEPMASGILPTMGRGLRPGPRGFNNVLLQLRRGLASARGGDRVTIMAVGWRFRRGRLVPLLIEFGAWREGDRSAALAMRGPRTHEPRQRVVGVMPSTATIIAANANREPVVDAPSHAQRTTDVFTDIIRRTSRENPTVGAHVMTVTIPRPPYNRITMQFDPNTVHHVLLREGALGSRVPVVFSPWVVTDVGFNAAAVMAGMLLSYPMCGWTFEMTGASDQYPREAPAFMIEQTREPMPGRPQSKKR